MVKRDIQLTESYNRSDTMGGLTMRWAWNPCRVRCLFSRPNEQINSLNSFFIFWILGMERTLFVILFHTYTHTHAHNTQTHSHTHPPTHPSSHPPTNPSIHPSSERYKGSKASHPFHFMKLVVCPHFIHILSDTHTRTHTQRETGCKF